MGFRNVNVMCMDMNFLAIIIILGGADCNVRLFLIGGQHLGQKV